MDGEGAAHPRTARCRRLVRWVRPPGRRDGGSRQPPRRKRRRRRCARPGKLARSARRRPPIHRPVPNSAPAGWSGKEGPENSVRPTSSAWPRSPCRRGTNPAAGDRRSVRARAAGRCPGAMSHSAPGWGRVRGSALLLRGGRAPAARGPGCRRGSGRRERRRPPGRGTPPDPSGALWRGGRGPGRSRRRWSRLRRHPRRARQRQVNERV